MRLGLVALAAIAFLLVASGPAQAGPLRLGFTDRDAFQGNAHTRAVALQRLRAARGSLVRLIADWREIERSRPPDSATARNPFWPGYSWGSLDAEVRDVAAAGATPVLNILGAPAWAEGPGRPPLSAAAPLGTWRPSPAAFRNFAQAAARRYSGAVPGIPAVKYLQGWNEPNIAGFLSPQWARRGQRLVPAAPAHYRRLLNAFYLGAKAGNPRARIISAGLGPFGDPRRGSYRLPPALFARQWLCVRGRHRPRPVACSGAPARFDILAHHPYSVGSPTRRALNTDDVTIPDLRKLTRPLAAATRGGRVFPRRHKQLWVTEMSWDSRPPDPFGVSAGTHARWLEGGFYQLWRQGVDAITWFNLRDQPRGRGYEFSYQSGLFLRGASILEDRAKPAYTAFRFPFTAYRLKGRTRLWGIAPRAGGVRIEIRRGGRWRRLTSVRARAGRVFARSFRVARGRVLRATQQGEASLSWRSR